MAKLNPKQRKFVLSYEGNATEAALVAGYSAKTAYSQGQRLLKHAEVLKAIEAKRELSESILIADITERKELLSLLARGSPKECAKAIDILNKMDAVYIQRHEVSVTEGRSRQEMLEGAAEELRKAGWKVEPPD